MTEIVRVTGTARTYHLEQQVALTPELYHRLLARHVGKRLVLTKVSLDAARSEQRKSPGKRSAIMPMPTLLPGRRPLAALLEAKEQLDPRLTVFQTLGIGNAGIRMREFCAWELGNQVIAFLGKAWREGLEDRRAVWISVPTPEEFSLSELRAIHAVDPPVRTVKGIQDQWLNEPHQLRFVLVTPEEYARLPNLGGAESAGASEVSSFTWAPGPQVR